MELEYRAREVARQQKLHEKSITSTRLLDEALFGHRRADIALRAAKMDNRAARIELHQAQILLDRRTIRSPVDGVVVELTMSPGEYAYEQSQLITIAQIDPLYVETFVPVSHYNTLSKGMRAVVLPEPPIGGNYQAHIEIIDNVIDAASGTIGVRVELPNPDHLLPAGLKCRVRFVPR